MTDVAYVANGRLEHRVARADARALSDLKQLLHLKTTDLTIPPADEKPRRPALLEGEPLVRLTQARIAYGEKVIFSHLDWSISSGEHWQVTGPNGSGKTCLLNLITGDHPQCYVNDIRVFGMQRGSGESIWDIKQYIGYVSSALQWEYKVSVNVRNAIISGFYDSIGIYQKYTDVQKEIADAWLPAFYTAEAAITVWGDALKTGASKRDPQRPPLNVFAGGSVAIGEGLEHLRDLSRPGAALYIGGMGARSKNFYNDIFAKSGYAAEAKMIQDLYLAGEKKAAEEAIPEQYLANSSLIGPEGFVKERLQALKESGATSLNVNLMGQEIGERVSQLEKLRNLVDSM